MPQDLALIQRPSGKYDFVRTPTGDLQRTGDKNGRVQQNVADPAILRQLLQDAWIGDNGERAGQSLASIKLFYQYSNGTTLGQARGIDRQRTAVGEGVHRRVHRVRQPPRFTNLLEQP